MTTANLKLICCDVDILTTAIEGNHQLAKKLGVTVPANWTEFGKAPLQYTLGKLLAEDSEFGWWTYFPIHKTDNKLIGSGGYKGRPSADGEVEIGYEIAADYRNKGLATEMATALIKNAFLNEDVQIISAHTLGYENPSTRVLSKCGFVRVAEINDPDDGVIWKWELKRT